MGYPERVNRHHKASTEKYISLPRPVQKKTFDRLTLLRPGKAGSPSTDLPSGDNNPCLRDILFPEDDESWITN